MLEASSCPRETGQERRIRVLLPTLRMVNRQSTAACLHACMHDTHVKKHAQQHVHDTGKAIRLHHCTRRARAAAVCQVAPPRCCGQHFRWRWQPEPGACTELDASHRAYVYLVLLPDVNISADAMTVSASASASKSMPLSHKRSSVASCRLWKGTRMKCPTCSSI
jgi:hypothetical protein